MSLKIREIRPASEQEWDAVWSRCGYATYFHSREWAEIWGAVSHNGFKASPQAILFSDGKKVLLPLVSTKIFKGLMRNYYSSYCGTYGGPIAEDPLTAGHADLVREYMTKRLGNLRWRMNPFDEFTPAVGEGSILRDATSALRLEGDFESICKGFVHQNRSNIRKASESGISIVTANDLEDWKAYFLIYQDSLKRWGDKTTSNYPWEVFEEMYERRSANIRLWLALYENKAIAGNLCFYSKKIVASWHGAALETYFNLRPVNLLWHQIIRDTCGRGYSWLDFGPSGGHEGVLRFKRTFGTKEISCPMVEVTGPLGCLVSKVRESLKRNRPNL